MKNTKTGLVLEGGGMRGIYTAGVLDVFMINKITFDGVIGVSAGAIHGGTYLSGQIGRNLRYYKKYCTDDRFISVKNIITTGDVAGEDFCYHEIPDRLDPFDYEAFKKNKADFYAVCSNLESGKAEYLKITDMKSQIEVLRASASLPYVSKPVLIDNKNYLDGGCTDSIPIEAFRKMGYKYNVVVLTQDINYRKSPEMRVLAKIKYRKYPKFVKALLDRHVMYNKTVENILELEKNNEIFVIRPEEPLHIDRLEKNPEKIQYIYNKGYNDAKKNLQNLKSWLSSK